jgi:hypothetical protein
MRHQISPSIRELQEQNNNNNNNSWIANLLYKQALYETGTIEMEGKDWKRRSKQKSRTLKS